MKKRLKSFLKYTLFSSFFSAVAVASPIASPGTSTIYNGVNSGILYSPTVNNNNNGISCSTIHYLVNEHVQGWYSKTVDLSPFTQCSNATLVIKAAGGKGGYHGGLGGITILRIPLQTIINYYGSKVTFDYVVGGAGYGLNPGGNGGGGSSFSQIGGGGGGGESLVSIINWPWYGGVPLAIGGGGGGGSWYFVPSGFGTMYGKLWYIGGGGGGGNDGGGGDDGGYDGYGGSVWLGDYCSGGGGWYGSGSGGNTDGNGSGGGGGYGGGGPGYYNSNSIGSVSGGGGGGGYCNTSLGTCQASDWTNGGGNPGNGYVEIYVESNE